MKAAASKSASVPHFRDMPGHLVRRLHQISIALFSDECGKVGITPVQYAVLFSISEAPGMDATRLTEVVALDRSTLGAVLERLEKKALVDRRPSLNDRRVKLLFLTPSGRRLLNKASVGVLRVQERLLAPLSAADRARFVDLLKLLGEGHVGLPLVEEK